MSITTAALIESEFPNNRHHANLDKSNDNLHHPIGFRDATVGDVLWKNENGNFGYEQVGQLPAALNYVDVTAVAPTEVLNDVYLLDDSGAVFTVSAIDFQSGNTVRYTMSGSPDLSGLSTANNVLLCQGATNSEHNGRFVLTAVNDGSDFFEVTNVLVSDTSLDETTGASLEAPHTAWDGASNGDWVRFDGTDWFRVTPTDGAQCYDKTLNMTRTWDTNRWLGDHKEHIIAVSDEDTDLTTGTSKLIFRMPFKFFTSEVRASVGTAPTGSTIIVDINDDATTMLSAKLTIDATEKTSTTAATAAVISVANIADDSEITIDIDQVGSTITGAGLKITIIGNMI